MAATERLSGASNIEPDQAVGILISFQGLSGHFDAIVRAPRRHVAAVADHDWVKEVLVQVVDVFGRYLSLQAQERGMINRTMGDVLAFCPSSISTEKDINEILGTFETSLDATQH
ncbi:hypothetical protein [Pseudomonas sp. CLCA07]